MRASFIDKIRLKKKSLTEFTMEQKQERPERLGIHMGLLLQDNLDDDTHVFEGGSELDVKISLKFSMYDFEHPEFQQEDPSDEAKVFDCKVSMRLLAIFRDDLEIEKGMQLVEEYAQEILSLTYDDFRIIVDENVSKTDFRGFQLPLDFRELLEPGGRQIET